MRYYALYENNGRLLSIGTGPGGMQITAEEYNALLSEIKEKSVLVESVYQGEKPLESVAENWREEISRRVTLLIEEAEKGEEIPVSPEEIVSALFGERTFTRKALEGLKETFKGVKL